ncbi:MAG: TetR family transcriptional regulator [Rhodospirillales bacterium]|nr:TetR family transcriptional regulator [Rhodospirillales bacterium]
MDKSVSDAPTAGKRDPETRRRWLTDAARREFMAKGLEGARVDEIAKQAGVNKQLVYHYFGNKEAFYLHILEKTYEAMIEAKTSLELDTLAPPAAIERLVGFTFDYMAEHPEFVALLNDENVHKARHLRQSERVPAMHKRLIAMIDAVMRRGEKDGSLRQGIDTVQFYITLSGMCYFTFTNMHTLSVVFGRDLSTPAALSTRRAHIIEMMMASVRP